MRFSPVKKRPILLGVCMMECRISIKMLARKVSSQGPSISSATIHNIISQAGYLPAAKGHNPESCRDRIEKILSEHAGVLRWLKKNGHSMATLWRPEDEFRSYAVESGIPLPGASLPLLPLTKMKDGDSFLVPEADLNGSDKNIAARIYRAAKLVGIKVKVKRVGEGLRVWKGSSKQLII